MKIYFLLRKRGMFYFFSEVTRKTIDNNKKWQRQNNNKKCPSNKVSLKLDVRKKSKTSSHANFNHLVTEGQMFIHLILWQYFCNFHC